MSKYVTMRPFILTQHRHWTDRQTDRETDRQNWSKYHTTLLCIGWLPTFVYVQWHIYACLDYWVASAHRYYQLLYRNDCI